jgi:hypothetical protein
VLLKGLLTELNDRPPRMRSALKSVHLGMFRLFDWVLVEREGAQLISDQSVL